MFSGFRVVGKASGMAHIEEHVIHVMYMGFNFPEYYFLIATFCLPKDARGPIRSTIWVSKGKDTVGFAAI